MDIISKTYNAAVDRVRVWARDRNIYSGSTFEGQYKVFLEEVDELKEAADGIIALSKIIDNADDKIEEEEQQKIKHARMLKYCIKCYREKRG